MGQWPVYWLDPTEYVQVRLRVLRHGVCPQSATKWCCDNEVTIRNSAPLTVWKTRVEHADDRGGWYWHIHSDNVSDHDVRWPLVCKTCGDDMRREVPDASGHPFSAHRQVWAETLCSGHPSGTLYTVRNAPIGAMWDAEYLHGAMRGAFVGPDGISLHVRTPGGDWCVDSQASNCTRDQHTPVPGEAKTFRFERTHYCWVRHGDPRAGQVHVDKSGNTCAAGAGSIDMNGRWHGFLHNSVLSEQG